MSDLIYMVQDRFSQERRYYDADCAQYYEIQGKGFDPALEVQFSGDLPLITCAACGAELTDNPDDCDFEMDDESDVEEDEQ